MKLTELPNIGPVIAEQLVSVGIETPQALADCGAEQAWLKIKAVDSSACANRLYGLEGAVLGIPKKKLPPERVEELRAFYLAHK
ncbi:MAG: TfoX/Sxy family protein [Raoultibacter sp.]|jgi:DNA transformation protein